MKSRDLAALRALAAIGGFSSGFTLLGASCGGSLMRSRQPGSAARRRDSRRRVSRFISRSRPRTSRPQELYQSLCRFRSPGRALRTGPPGSWPPSSRSTRLMRGTFLRIVPSSVNWMWQDAPPSFRVTMTPSRWTPKTSGQRTRQPSTTSVSARFRVRYSNSAFVASWSSSSRDVRSVSFVRPPRRAAWSKKSRFMDRWRLTFSRTAAVFCARKAL
mmetsp:Transcript_11699/g.40157  ORF Transcript_11699/g.40157 Transcript_11699/m.40157 type:complete len:216 (-) Transcript_11699:549-1196(-)